MAALGRAAFSQSPRPSSPPRTLSVRVDNDAFDFWQQPYNRPDEEYTSGVRIALEGGDAPWWSRSIFRNSDACIARARACRSARLEIGKDIYTPSVSLDDPHAAANSRPNTGWLFVSQSARSLRDRRADELTITVGVTGPAALGEQMQRFFHSLAPEFNRPTDWTRQTAFEPGLILRYETRSRLAAVNAGALGFDLIPRAAFSIGNITTAAEAGFLARTGVNLRHPWLPADSPISIELSAGASGRAVARDLFLDGNTFTDGPRVKRKPLTGSGEAGIDVRLRWFSAGYRAVSDYRSYEGGPKWHAWGSLTGAVTFSR